MPPGLPAPDPPPRVTPSSRARWLDLRRRALSASLLAPGALLCLWAGSVVWAALVLLMLAGLAHEWTRLCGARGHGVTIAIAAVGLVAILLARTWPAAALAAVALGTLGLLPAAHGPRRRLLPLGLPYVAVPAVALVWLRGVDATGEFNLLFLVLVVWAADIGGYAFGRAIGGPRLAPRISPGKTWSGAAGGIAVALVVAAVFALAVPPAVAAGASPLPGRAAIGPAMILAAVLSIVAQGGDLMESALKRHVGVKDSGRLIPGHGGLLDRLDGLLTAAPVAALLAASFGRTLPLWR